MSRAEHLKHIRTVQIALAATLDLVFMGGKVMALYAKATGDTLRTTNDVDSLVAMEFGPLHRALSKLVTTRVISPEGRDPVAPLCRYRLVDSGIAVDIVDLDGRLTGGVNPYHRRAVEAREKYDAGEGVAVHAITPPFFPLTKLVSLRDEQRTELSVAHHDAEDIVSLFVEVDDLVAQIECAGLLVDVHREFHETLRALAVRDPADLLEFWLHPDVPDRARIVGNFLTLAAAPERL